MRFITLALPLFGTQVAWSFEFSYGTPILLERGFTPFLTTLVWLAGPLTGLIIQPLFGAISDEYTSTYGKRRPFIVIGWFTTILSLILLMFKGPYPILTSFIAFYMLDASLNISMSAIRSLMVDSTENDDQIQLNGWASRIVGAGSLTGYLLSMINFNFSDQLKSVAIIVIIILTITTMITMFSIEEKSYVEIDSMEDYARLFENRQPRSRDPDDSRIFSALKNIYAIARSVPYEEDLLYIFKVQFFSWVAWFPILFYNSAWLVKLVELECPTCTFDEKIRASSAGMMFFSVIAFVASILVPFAFSMAYVESNKKRSIRMMWTMSQAIFSVITAILVVVSYFDKMTYLVGALLISGLGFSWAITIWIPFVLLSEYTISTRPDDAGALLGLTNIFIVLPQFLSIAVCSSILWFTSDITWIFSVACLSSFVASLAASTSLM